MTDNARAGLPPFDMHRPFNAIGGLWESTDKRGRSCLRGHLEIAGVTFAVIAYPPLASGENSPAWVISVATADIADILTRLDELRNPAGQTALPF